MKAEALLDKHPDPTREEISARAARQPLPLHRLHEDHRCDRARSRDASRRAAPRAGPERPGRGARGPLPGHASSPSATSRSSATWSRPGCSTARCASPTIPRARVLRIDTSKAQAYPGVVARRHRGRRPGRARRRARSPQTGANSSPTARTPRTSATCSPPWPPTRAMQHARPPRLIEVEYEVLEPVTDPFEALADGAPKLHERGNVLSVSDVERGDVDAALARRRARRSRDLPDAVHRARVPRARVVARRSGAGRLAPRLLTGPGQSGTTASRSPRSSGFRTSASVSRRSRPAARSAPRRT